MFQDFSDQSESRLTPARIASLRDRLQQLGVDGFIVHPVTLAEVLVHPLRRGREQLVLDRLEAIGMELAAITLDPVSLARYRANSSLKMPDCIVAECARQLGLNIATFDLALQRALGTDN